MAGILSYSTLAVARHREGMNEWKPLTLLFSLKSILSPHSVWFSWKHLFHKEMFLKQRALFELMEWKHPFKRRMLIKHFCYCTASRNTGEKHSPLNPAACYDVSTMEICLSARSSASFGTSPVLSSLRPVHLCLPDRNTVKDILERKCPEIDSSEKAMAPYSSTLAWKTQGWRSLVGCNPWGH